MYSSLTFSANSTLNYLISVFFEHGDQRTKNWLLSNTPWPLFGILAFYLFFCLYAGPRYMRDRKPYELKNTMIIYNAIQVIISCVLFYEVSSWRCLLNGMGDIGCVRQSEIFDCP